MSELAKAFAAVEAGDYEEASRLLVRSWRERRDPKLAELVELVDARLRIRPFAELLAHRVTETVHRLREAAESGDDPRLGTFLVASLAAPPFVGASSRPFWEAALEIAGRLRDPRVAAAAARAAPTIRAHLAPAPLRDEVLEGLRAVASPEDEIAVREPTAEETRLQAAIAARFEKAKQGAKTEADLLAAIHADPHSDAPRLVYADYLHERGDPRGELISLQFKPSLTDREKVRERSLLEKHMRKWLGALAPVVSSTEAYSKTRFERGFLAVADLYLNCAKKLPLTYRAPEWATVREVLGAQSPLVLQNVKLPSLRHIDGASPATLSELARRGPYPGFTDLTLWLVELGPATSPARRLLSDLRAFPNLQTLSIGLDPRAGLPGEIRWLLESAAAPARIRRLEILRAVVEPGELAGATAAFEDALREILTLPAPIEELAIRTPWASHKEAKTFVELRRAGAVWTRGG
jgi:uncharacterized protein (TIGR02996 family)